MLLEKHSIKNRPKFEVVSLFLTCNQKSLYLLRLPHKPEGSMWGAPAGKVDKGETRERAMIRELSEETGVKIKETELNEIGLPHVVHDGIAFDYYTYRVLLEDFPKVTVRTEEHQTFGWFTKEEILMKPLVTDMDDCIKMYI